MDYFTKLPNEITNIILSYLSFSDVIQLRRVSKRFKIAIDMNEEVWVNGQLVIKVDAQSQHKLFDGIKFFHEFGKFDCVELDCPDEIDMNLFKKQLVSFKMTNLVQNVDSIKLNVRQINIDSLEVLNLFSDICVNLTINSFTRKLVPDETNETLYKQLQIKSRTKVFMPKLRKFLVYFKVLNDYQNDEQFEKWIKMIIYSIYRVEEVAQLDSYKKWVKDKIRNTRLYYDSQLNQQIIETFKINKKIIKEFEAHFYYGSVNKMIQFLNNMQLDYLCFYEFSDYNFSYVNRTPEKKCKFSTKTVQIIKASENNVCQLFKKHPVLEDIEKLVLININGSIQSFLKSIESNLINLKKFESDLCSLERSFLCKIYENVEELDFHVNLGIYYLVKLINDVLPVSEKLKKIKLRFELTSDYVDIVNRFIKTIDILVHKYPNLEELSLDILSAYAYGHDLNKCLLYKYYGIAKSGTYRLDNYFENHKVKIIADVSFKNEETTYCIY